MDTVLKENLMHSTEKMHIAVYRHRIDIPDMSIVFQLHWHSEYELIYIFNGHTVFDIEGISYHVKQGQGVIINHDAIHSCKFKDDKTVSFACIVFSESFLFSDCRDEVFKKYFAQFYNNHLIPPVFLSGEQKWERDALECMRRMLEEYFNDAPARFLYMKIQLLEIFYIMIKEGVLKQTGINSGKQAHRIRNAILLIQQNFDKPINVKDLAESQNMCHEYFSRLFRSITGVTPKSYITNYRVEQAEAMLVSGGGSLMDVAVHCGFEDVNYFSRCFKKVKGYSPSAVKNLAAISSNISLFKR